MCSTAVSIPALNVRYHHSGEVAYNTAMTTISPSSRTRAAILDRLYRQLQHLDDQSLAELDALVASGGGFEFVDEATVAPEKLSRRAFLLWFLAGGVITATGGAALLLAGNPSGAAKPAIPTAVLHGDAITGTLTAPQADTDPGSLQAELAALRSERIGLRAQLETLRTDLESSRAELETTLVDLETTRADNAALAADLQARTNDIAYLQQVITLYQQMEAAELDDRVMAGLTPLNLALLALGTARGLLQAGVNQAAGLLAGIELQAPVIAEGLLWLETQINQLAATLQAFEDTLSGLVEPVKPVAQQIGDFIGQVLDILPFGVGQNIRAGLEAIGLILTHIPELVGSINTMLITPLRQWISVDSDKGLVAEVVNPISANLIAPAQTMVDHTTALETAFHDRLKTPVEEALAVRAELRQTLYRLTGVS